MVGIPIANRRPQHRGTDRVLREHAGAARPGGLGGAVRCGAAPGAADGAGGVCAPGRSVRGAGERTVAGAQSEPQPVVPGDVRAARRAGCGGGVGRRGGARAKARDAQREVRSVPGPERAARGAGEGLEGVQHRLVRVGHRRADGAGTSPRCWRGSRPSRIRRSGGCRC